MNIPENEMLAIKERVEEDLFKIPGVNGVGFAKKCVYGIHTEQLAIIVYVAKKLPIEDIPVSQRIASRIEEVPTDVVELPEMVTLSGPGDDKEYAELRAGIQIGAGGEGTLSFIGETTDSYSRGPGRIVLVSNQHVLCGITDNVQPGSSRSIGQPTTHGCCESCDFCSRIIGHLRSACVANPEVDGGVAELQAGTQWFPEVQDPPRTVPITNVYNLLEPGIRFPYPIWKRGCTTLRTVGEVHDPYYSQPVKIGRTTRAFCGMIIIGPLGVDFAAFGDSGSPIMDNSNRIVGILIAAGTGSKSHIGFACHIKHVQSQLHVIVKTKANTLEGVQTVPEYEAVPSNRIMKGPPLPMTAAPCEAVPVAGKLNPRTFYEKLVETRAGREFVSHLTIHQDEIRQLARITRVIAAWRRNGGTAVTADVSRGLDASAIVVPESYRGRSADRCAHAIAKELTRYARPELAAAIARYVPEVKRFAGKSVDEILTILSQELFDNRLPTGAVHA